MPVASVSTPWSLCDTSRTARVRTSSFGETAHSSAISRHCARTTGRCSMSARTVSSATESDSGDFGSGAPAHVNVSPSADAPKPHASTSVSSTSASSTSMASPSRSIRVSVSRAGPRGGSAHVALSSAITGGGIAGASRSSLVKCSLRAGVWESTSPTARVISVLAYGPTRVALDALSRADEPSASFSPPSDVVPIRPRVWLTKIAPNSRVDARAAKRSGNAETRYSKTPAEGVCAPAMSAADDAVSASSPPAVP
mmetsp:Transcript_11701/g.49062  ORF Transcript_11701/g.49062 Transcript_11701/m.49062 type:complete len:255 (+) Transcript_11701:2012-2776(+)